MVLYNSWYSSWWAGSAKVGIFERQAIIFMYLSTSNLYTDNPTSSNLVVLYGGVIQKEKGLLLRKIIGGTTRKPGSVAVFWEDVLSTGERTEGEYSQLSFPWDYWTGIGFADVKTGLIHSSWDSYVNEALWLMDLLVFNGPIFGLLVIILFSVILLPYIFIA